MNPCEGEGGEVTQEGVSWPPDLYHGMSLPPYISHPCTTPHSNKKDTKTNPLLGLWTSAVSFLHLRSRVEVRGGGVWDGTEASLLASQLCGPRPQLPNVSTCQRQQRPQQAVWVSEVALKCVISFPGWPHTRLTQNAFQTKGHWCEHFNIFPSRVCVIGYLSHERWFSERWFSKRKEFAC